MMDLQLADEEEVVVDPHAKQRVHVSKAGRRRLREAIFEAHHLDRRRVALRFPAATAAEQAARRTVPAHARKRRQQGRNLAFAIHNDRRARNVEQPGHGRSRHALRVIVGGFLRRALWAFERREYDRVRLEARVRSGSRDRRVEDYLGRFCADVDVAERFHDAAAWLLLAHPRSERRVEGLVPQDVTLR